MSLEAIFYNHKLFCLHIAHTHTHKQANTHTDSSYMHVCRQLWCVLFLAMRLRRTHTHTRTHTDTHTHAHKLICTNTFVAQIYVKKIDKTAENVVFLTFAPLTFAIKHFSLIYQQGCGIFFCMRRFSFTSDRPLPLLLLCCCRCCYCLCLPACWYCLLCYVSPCTAHALRFTYLHSLCIPIKV